MVDGVKKKSFERISIRNFSQKEFPVRRIEIAVEQCHFWERMLAKRSPMASNPVIPDSS
jgi:hypothetical protein